MTNKPEQESPLVKNHAKNSNIEQCAYIDHHFCFHVVFTPQQNPTMRKGCLKENTQCQNKDACTPNVSMRQKMLKTNLPLYFLRFTWMAHTCKPLVSLLHKQQLKLRKCSGQPNRLQDPTRYQDFAKATKLKGKDMVIQLLKCCEEQLWKDLKRNTGSSLTNNTHVQLHNLCQCTTTSMIVGSDNHLSLSHFSHSLLPPTQRLQGTRIQAYQTAAENNNNLHHGWYRLPELPG